MPKHLLIVLMLLLPATALICQAQTAAQNAPTPAPAAKPGDVDTVEHIVAALYDVISGPAGTRDWGPLSFAVLFRHPAYSDTS